MSSIPPQSQGHPARATTGRCGEGGAIRRTWRNAPIHLQTPNRRLLRTASCRNLCRLAVCVPYRLKSQENAVNHDVSKEDTVATRFVADRPTPASNPTFRWFRFASCLNAGHRLDGRCSGRTPDQQYHKSRGMPRSNRPPLCLITRSWWLLSSPLPLLSPTSSCRYSPVSRESLDGDPVFQ